MIIAFKTCTSVSSADIIIGFTQETCTFSEGQSNTFVTIANDGGVVSERTDIAVNISLQGVSTATQGEDFEMNHLNTTIQVDPGVQEVNIPVIILEDLLPEGVESFTLTVFSVGFGFSAESMDTFATTEVFIRNSHGMFTMHNTITDLTYLNNANARLVKPSNGLRKKHTQVVNIANATFRSPGPSSGNIQTKNTET